MHGASQPWIGFPWHPRDALHVRLEYIQKERQKRVKEIKNYENESATKNVDIDKKEMNNIEDIFTGRPDKKDGMMEKIKKWISNFI